ncbi:MAG: glycosyltransferase family 4 protein [Hyphomicrobiaceae bacterium]
MRIAVYAPLNPPDGPTPSGDRLIGRMLIRALEDAGHEVCLASRFRTFDRNGDRERQARISRLGARLASRYLRRLERSPPDLWLTYHLYHKAPDPIGPLVSCALSIPYVVVEASLTPSAAAGPWAAGHAEVVAALARADLVVGINPRDRPEVARHLRPGATYAEMPIFIDGAAYREAATQREAHRQQLRTALGARPEQAVLLAVGMMRSRDKLDSYRLLAAALERMPRRDWHLAIAGDGPLQAEAHEAFARLAERTTFLGRVDASGLPSLYAGADLLVWPAIKEALGMCFLESQAAGTPVVGARREGVASLVCHGQTGLLPNYGDPSDFAKAVGELIGDRQTLTAMREHAFRNAWEHHDIKTAGPRFAALLASIGSKP